MKKTDDPLRAAMLEGLLRSVPLGIAIVDTELRYLEINPRLAEMHGLSQEAHLGKRISEIIRPDLVAQKIIECVRQVLRTGQPVEGVELSYRDPVVPSREVTRLASYHPFWHAGQLQGVYALVEDVTARRETERQRDELLARERLARERAEAVALALGESEARYRAILAALDEGIVVQGLDGQILTANASAERILGLSIDQMTGMTSVDPRWHAIHEDGLPFPGEEHPAMVALRTGIPQRSVPMGVQRSDGSRIWLSINAQPLRRSSSEPPHMVVVSFFDVTEFKRALQAIYLSEQRFRSLVEATTQMVWTADAQGHIREDSPSWRAYTGQSMEEFLTGLNWLEAIHPDDREHTLARWKEAVARAAPLRIENRVRRYDGQYRLFQVRAVPVLAADGSVREWIGAHTDISEARKAERERALLLREAQEAVRSRDEFLTVAAHELRTPLTSLRLQLHMLLRQIGRGSPELAAQLTSRSDAMERQIGRLASLIYTLMDVSRLAAERLSLEPREMDLTQLVKQLADAFAEECQRVGAELRFHGAEQALVGVWDPLRVEQVVANLLSNAVRYGLGKPVDVSLWREGGMAVLSVKDQGIGISEVDMARVFGKFERAVSERHYGGLGLGLYITRQILNAMGGSIEVSSSPGKGSTFTVRLPMKPPISSPVGGTPLNGRAAP